MLSGVTENKTSQSEYSSLMLVWYLFQSRDDDLRDRVIATLRLYRH